MSAWKDFPHDFLRRTLANIEEYHGDYEVTNLINNCLGLIVIPSEHLIDTLPNYTFDFDDSSFGINRRNIKYEHKKDYTLHNIVRHIRNGISHGRIKQQTEHMEIVGLKIYDRWDKQSHENFCVELSIHELKLFAFSLAKIFLVEQ